MKAFGLVFMALLIFVLVEPVEASCFSPDACQNSQCKTSEFVTCPGGSPQGYCAQCGSGGGGEVPCYPSGGAAIRTGTFCWICGGPCTFSPYGTPPAISETETTFDEPFSALPRLQYSLLFSRDLLELESIWNMPQIVGALLLLEAAPGSDSVERPATMQLISSSNDSRAHIANRVQYGITFEEAALASDSQFEQAMPVDFLVDSIVHQIDPSTIEIILSSTPIDELIEGPGKSTAVTETTVLASNVGNAPHEYEITRIATVELGDHSRRGR